MKQRVKKDKKKCMDELAQQAEEAATANNTTELYNLTKIMAGKKTRCSLMPVRDTLWWETAFTRR